VLTELGEYETGAGDKVARGRRREDIAGCHGADYVGGDMDSDSPHLVVGAFALTGGFLSRLANTP
jgi:hypothetical protein